MPDKVWPFWKVQVIGTARVEAWAYVCAEDEQAARVAALKPESLLYAEWNLDSDVADKQAVEVVNQRAGMEV